jgi:hypothetical protein
MTFAGWTGSGIGNAGLATTSFIMPVGAATVTATYSNLPAPVFNTWQLGGAGTSFSVTAQAYPNHAWVLQTSLDLSTWVDAQSNSSDGSGALQFSIPVNSATPKQFFRLRAP